MLCAVELAIVVLTNISIETFVRFSMLNDLIYLTVYISLNQTKQGLFRVRFLRNKSAPRAAIHVIQLFTWQVCCRWIISFSKQTPVTWSKWPSEAILSGNWHLFSLCSSWWRHRMETSSALLALCAGNSPVTGEFPSQRPVTRNFGVFFDLRLNKRLSKQWWGWWFETPSCPLWRHCNILAFCRTSMSL